MHFAKSFYYLVFKFVIFILRYWIEEKLLIKALKFLESHTDISDENKHIINYSRKSLLFNNQQAWMKVYFINFQINIMKNTSAYIKMMVKSGPQAERIKKDFPGK